jgi:hypothetical protein
MTSNILRICDASDDDNYIEFNQKSAGDLDSILSNSKSCRMLMGIITDVYCFHKTGFLTLEETWTDEEKKYYKSKKIHTHIIKTTYYGIINKLLSRY